MACLVAARPRWGAPIAAPVHPPSGELRIVHALPDHAPSGACSAGSFWPRSVRRAHGVADEAWQTPRPAESGTRPSRANACTKLAERAAITRSQASARFAAPAATPLTAAITGREAAQRQNQRLVILVDRLAEIDGLAAGCDGAIAEILPGAEASPGAGEHQHARLPSAASTAPGGPLRASSR